MAAPLVGGAVGGFGVLLQYRALSLVDMSVVSPIIAGAALVPVLWGTAIGERPSPLQSLGIVLRSPVSSSSREERRCGRDLAVSDRTGILLAMAAAAAFGLFLVALDHGGKADPLWTVTVARTAAVLTLLAVAGSRARRSGCAAARSRRSWSSVS